MSGVEIGDFIGLMFLGLVLVIGLLGFFVLARLRREGRPAPSPIAQTGITVLLFAIAFFSTFVPYVALVPALMFFILGLRLLFGEASRRDGGIVLALLVIAWWSFMKFQASTLASGADIRVDLLLTLPVMTLIGSLGWRIYATEP
jgi:hypothetical protein